MNDKEKKLNLMRYWLFGSYAIIVAAITAFMYMIIPDDFYRLSEFWGFVGGLAVLFAAVFYIYKTILNRSGNTNKD